MLRGSEREAGEEETEPLAGRNDAPAHREEPGPARPGESGVSRATAARSTDPSTPTQAAEESPGAPPSNVSETVRRIT